MRIGIVTPRYPPTVAGGGEISVKLMVDHLAERGHDVEVFSFDDGTQSVVDGITVHRFRRLPHGFMELSNTYALLKLWQAQDTLTSFDVIHSYNVTLNPTVGRLSSTLKVPSVATLNTYDLLPKNTFGVKADPPRRLYELLAMPTTGRLLRREVKRIDRFVTLSDASRRIFREHGFGDVPIEVVPNMLDPAFRLPAGDQTEKSKGYDVLFVGSLIKEKGVSFLIRALTELPEDVSLRIVGSGKEEDALKAIAEKMGVTSRTVFCGQIPYAEVRQEYASADCFVHPGVWPEPFGRTILEAMQAGLPVVATNVGGPADVVPQADLLCSPRDPRALADTIKIARERPDIGEENRAYVYERYSPHTVIDALSEVYERALGGC